MSLVLQFDVKGQPFAPAEILDGRTDDFTAKVKSQAQNRFQNWFLEPVSKVARGRKPAGMAAAACST